MENTKEWKNEEGKLIKTFTFNNFVEAVDFVNKIVPMAEEANHHPDVEIFGYKNVKIKLSTHDEGDKITEKDVSLSKDIDSILF